MEPDDAVDPRLRNAYSLETPDDARSLYAEWADTYESGFIASSEYIYHRTLARAFLDRVGSIDGPVLDVGCGTGLVGEALCELELGPVDGLDISPEMLDRAAVKRTADGDPVYRRLMVADLLQALPIQSAEYGGIVSAGTFTHGHVGPAAIDELLRVAAPGCGFGLGINGEVYGPGGFEARFEAARADGSITGLELVEIEIYGATEGDLAASRALAAVFTKST